MSFSIMINEDPDALHSASSSMTSNKPIFAKGLYREQRVNRVTLANIMYIRLCLMPRQHLSSSDQNMSHHGRSINGYYLT